MSANHKFLFIIIIIITSYIPFNILTKVDEEVPFFDFFNEDQDSTEIEVSSTEESTESTESEETQSNETTKITSIDTITPGTISDQDQTETDITLDIDSTVNETVEIGDLFDEVDHLSNKTIEQGDQLLNKISANELGNFTDSLLWELGANFTKDAILPFIEEHAKNWTSGYEQKPEVFVDNLKGHLKMGIDYLGNQAKKYASVAIKTVQKSVLDYAKYYANINRDDEQG